MIRATLIAACICAAVASPARAQSRGPMPCRVARVIDGDTLVCDLSLGYGVWLMGRPVRLAGIDAPEMPTPDGRAAKAALEAMVSAAPAIVFFPDAKERKDKYGRFLGRLVGREDFAGALIRDGHGKPYDGGKR